MKIFEDLEQFAALTAGRVRWVRAADAIRRAPNHREGAMHSVGDSITYLRTPQRHPAETFVGHRRYLEVVCAGERGARLEVAAKADLSLVAEYSDLTDREHFRPATDGPAGAARIGTVTSVELAPEQILVCEIDEAIRWSERAAAPCTVVHVSVEGATFPNK